MKHPWLSADAALFLEQSANQRPVVHRTYKTYHRDTARFFQSLLPSDSRVLIIGVGVRELAETLACQERCFVEWGPSSASLPSFSSAEALADLSAAARQGPFDYVLLPFTLHFLQDIQGFLNALRPCLQSRTRLVVLQYNFFWAPAIQFAQKLGLRRRLPDLNWLSRQDVRNLLLLTQYQEVTAKARLLIPFHIPLLTPWLNRFLGPIVPFLCQKIYVIARRSPASVPPAEKTVSVVVPTRNEAGTIRDLLDRLPVLGSRCEVLFVEGHSRDETWEEIRRQIASHPRRSLFALQALRQTGSGKADAVRLGFSRASGDILLILDADLTVPPEDLPHFYEALITGSAEFVNGSRLVYRMEKYAMQVLNLAFNKLFGLWISWLIGQPIKDTLCGTKALFRADYDRVRARFAQSGADPFGDFELLFGAAWLNLKICDIPVRYKERAYGRTNIRRFRNGWQLVRFCWRCWGAMP